MGIKSIKAAEFYKNILKHTNLKTEIMVALIFHDKITQIIGA